MTGMETLLAGAVTVLSGTISYLFKLFYDSRKEVLTELKDCQEDREKLWADRAELYRQQAANFDKFNESLPKLISEILNQQKKDSIHVHVDNEKQS